MTAREYEFYLRVLKVSLTLHDRAGIRVLSSSAESISHSFVALTRERYFQQEKIKFVSPSGHVMFYLLYRY